MWREPTSEILHGIRRIPDVFAAHARTLPVAVPVPRPIPLDIHEL